MNHSPSVPGQTRIWSHFQNAAPESFAASHPRLDWLVREVARRAGSTPPAVLNIGIGDGYFERQALARGWDIHALDPDAQAVARLAADGVNAQTGLVQHLPLPAQSVRFVVASEVLEHLTDNERQAGVAEIARVLEDGGWFLGTVPYREIMADQQVVCPCCGEVFHRWGHQRSFDEDAIREQLGPWFDLEAIGHTAFVPWRGRGLAGRVKSAVRLLLAKLGEPIAFPTLYWIAHKMRQPVTAGALAPAATPA